MHRQRLTLCLLLLAGPGAAQVVAAGSLKEAIALAAHAPDRLLTAQAYGYKQCRRLHGLFLARRDGERRDLAEALAAQAAAAYRQLLAQKLPLPLELEVQLQLGRLLQERARWYLDRNAIRYAAEVDRDLRDAAALCRRVFQAAPDPDGGAPDPWEDLRMEARLAFGVNFYLAARLRSPADPRHLVNLNRALTLLADLALRYDRYLAGREAYLYYGLALKLAGDPKEARAVLADLLYERDTPWTAVTAPFLEEVTYHYVKLAPDREGLARVHLMRARLTSLGRAPGYYGRLALAEAIRLQARLDGPAAAWKALEETAAWIRRQRGRWGRALAEAAAQVGARLEPSAVGARRPRAAYLAAAGELAGGDPRRALAWLAPLLRTPLPRDLPATPYTLASRAWERLGFLREAALAAAEAHRRRPTSAHARRLYRLRERLAARTGSPRDRAALRRAEAELPEYQGGAAFAEAMRLYRLRRFQAAEAAFARVPLLSRLGPLALAYRAYLRYLQRPGSLTAEDLTYVRAIRSRLARVPVDRPNRAPALALATLAQALVERRLGRSAAALTLLADFPSRFGTGSRLAGEALLVRLAAELDLGDLVAARRTLRRLEELSPRRQCLGRACLLFARHLDGRPGRTAEAVAFRERALHLLGDATPPREVGRLAEDLMALGRYQEAVRYFERLRREVPRPLAPYRATLTLAEARCLQQLGRPQAALALVEEVLRRHPRHVEPLMLQAELLGGTMTPAGRVLPGLGRWAEALRLWTRLRNHAERKSPYGRRWFIAQFHRAFLFWQRGDPDGARRVLRWIRLSGYRFRDAGDPAVTARLEHLAHKLGLRD